MTQDAFILALSSLPVFSCYPVPSSDLYKYLHIAVFYTKTIKTEYITPSKSLFHSYTKIHVQSSRVQS